MEKILEEICMNILFLCATYPEGSNTSLTKDLSNAMAEQGHTIKVVTLLEKKYKKETYLTTEGLVDVLRVKVGDIFNSVNKFQKFLSVLSFPRALYFGICEIYGNEKFDLIITHTPFIANAMLVKKLKKKYSCSSLLLLWDIFPQNAVDLGMIKKYNPLYFFLRLKEKKMLAEFDSINCMSEGNKLYLLSHNSFLDEKKIMVNYNWSKIDIKKEFVEQEKLMVRKKFNYSLEDKICVFGGNVGKPQAIENIVLLAEKLKNIHFLFIVKGTEKNKLHLLTESLGNVKILDFVKREEYELIIGMCDIGLVSLDPRFTVPNFPSKTVDYLKSRLPIFALLDSCSAQDYGSLIEGKGFGQYILADQVDVKYLALKNLLSDDKKLSEMKTLAFEFYKNFLDVDKISKNILAPIKISLIKDEKPLC